MICLRRGKRHGIPQWSESENIMTREKKSSGMPDGRQSPLPKQPKTWPKEENDENQEHLRIHQRSRVTIDCIRSRPRPQPCVIQSAASTATMVGSPSPPPNRTSCIPLVSSSFLRN